MLGGVVCGGRSFHVSIIWNYVLIEDMSGVTEEFLVLEEAVGVSLEAEEGVVEIKKYLVK